MAAPLLLEVSQPMGHRPWNWPRRSALNSPRIEPKPKAPSPEPLHNPPSDTPTATAIFESPSPPDTEGSSPEPALTPSTGGLRRDTDIRVAGPYRDTKGTLTRTGPSTRYRKLPPQQQYWSRRAPPRYRRQLTRTVPQPAAGDLCSGTDNGDGVDGIAQLPGHRGVAGARGSDVEAFDAPWPCPESRDPAAISVFEPPSAPATAEPGMRTSRKGCWPNRP